MRLKYNQKVVGQPRAQAAGLNDTYCPYSACQCREMPVSVLPMNFLFSIFDDQVDMKATTAAA
jgi:hypothetical protein